MLLISGLGISYLGNWIYLIALNISILDLTGSAAAVAGLYVIRPIAMLMTNFWAGSIIDRVSKRKLMIFIDVIRGVLVFVIPFMDSLLYIYLLLLIINMVGTFFGPSSSVYITKLVPIENRKRFNSIMSITNSGAFLLGPAISGILIMFVGTDLCIIINSLSFLICGFLIYFLPEFEEQVNKKGSLQWKTFIHDWLLVKAFVIKMKYFFIVYLLFQVILLIGFALDSQEVTFIKQHLQLIDRDYGFIVSIAGIGALIGGFISAIIAKKVKLNLYLGAGMLLASVGYVLFYSSFNFLTATIAFVFLGFFMAFANAGYATFFQNNVPVEIMGRFGSLTDLLQGMVQIVLTLILGFIVEWFPLQIMCLLFSFIGLILALLLFITVLLPSKAKYFEE